MSQPQLDYETPRSRPRRFMSVLLLFLQVNAAIMMAFTGVMFWSHFVYSISEEVTTKSSFTVYDLFAGFADSVHLVTPFTLSGILFALCSICARVAGNAAT